jgi:hypothetical protein
MDNHQIVFLEKRGWWAIEEIQRDENIKKSKMNKIGAFKTLDTMSMRIDIELKRDLGEKAYKKGPNR